MDQDAAHSSIVGGSTAGRILECPGSWAAINALPKSVEVPSAFAEEGIAMHAVMAQLMRDRMETGSCVPDDYIGTTFHDRVFTAAHCNEMIEPALAALGELERICGGSFQVIAVEHKIRLSDIKGAFGTVDLVMANDTHILHNDWKFGQGVGIRASYPDELGELLNPQLLYYVAGSKRLLPRERRKRIGAIIQPRSTEPLSYVEVTNRDIRYFIEDLQNAVRLAMAPEPPRRRGAWCRFAPCKVNCPLWTGPLLDLSSLNPVAAPPALPADDAVTPYGEYLARAKALLDSAVMLKAEVDAQMHSWLEAGGTIPGWRLKAKVRPRQWADEDVVIAALTGIGFSEDEIYQPRKLATFAAADAAARRRGVQIPDELRVAPVTRETTIASIDDPAATVERTFLAGRFAAALQRLEQEQESGHGKRSDEQG